MKRIGSFLGVLAFVLLLSPTARADAIVFPFDFILAAGPSPRAVLIALGAVVLLSGGLLIWLKKKKK